MVDVGVALAWVAISGVSLRWLSTLGRASAVDNPECDIVLREGEPLPEELYPLELTPLHVGGPR